MILSFEEPFSASPFDGCDAIAGSTGSEDGDGTDSIWAVLLGGGTGTDLNAEGLDGLDNRGDLAACTTPGTLGPFLAGRGDGSDDGVTELFTGVAGVRVSPFPNLVNEEAGTDALGVSDELVGSFPSCDNPEMVRGRDVSEGRGAPPSGAAPPPGAAPPGAEDAGM